MSHGGARTEVKRCIAAMAKGSDPEFWYRRLMSRVNYLQAEVAILDGAIKTAEARRKTEKRK